MKTEQRIALFVKKERREPEAWEVCPKAEACNLNKCPLHKDYPKLENDSSDYAVIHKQKCVEKTIRKQIGQHFKLKNEGLTFREISSARNWDKMPEEEREQRKQKLREKSPFMRLKSKGYAITRVKKEGSEFTNTKGDNQGKNEASREDIIKIGGEENEISFS